MRFAAIITTLLFTSAPLAAEAIQQPQRLAHFDMLPKAATLPDGTLAAYFLPVRGPGLAPTPPVQEMKCRISKDSGKTWGELHSLFTLPAEEGGFGFHAVLVDQQGEVHFMMMNDANTGMLRAREPKPGRPAVEPRDKQRIDIFHMRSTDNRTKWTKPKRIWEGRVSDLQSVIQLRSGRIVLPFGDTVRQRSWSNRGEGFAAYSFFGEFDTRCIYSDDRGDTWQTSKSVLRVPCPNNFGLYGAVEPVIDQLADGRVWMLIRTQTGRLWESFSADGAEWSPPQPTKFVSSDSPAAFVRLSDKRLVMFSNACQRYPYANGGRQVLQAAVSSDEGKTWRGRREVLRDPHRNAPAPPTGDFGVSYVYPAVAPDGRVVYSMWVQSGEGRSLESFDPRWLDETSAGDDFSNRLETWSVFGVKDAQVIAHPGSADHKVLSLHKAEADWPAGGAVWNFPFSERGTLRLRIQAQAGFGGALLMLSDHFSVPFDYEDHLFSLFKFPLDLPADRWVDLELRWDSTKQTCGVLIDGKAVTTLRQQRGGEGPSYLRIRCTGDAVDKGKLLIDSVQMSSQL